MEGLCRALKMGRTALSVTKQAESEIRRVLRARCFYFPSSSPHIHSTANSTESGSHSSLPPKVRGGMEGKEGGWRKGPHRRLCHHTARTYIVSAVVA